MTEALTDEQAGVLGIAASRWKYPNQRATAIRDQLGISETRWAQILDHVLDLPAAMVAEPVLVGRLRRLRSARAGVRASRPA